MAMRSPLAWWREEWVSFRKDCRILFVDLPWTVWVTIKYLPLILPLFLEGEEDGT